MAKKILIGVLVIITLFFGFIASQPADYTVSRDVVINAPVAKVFPYLNSPKLSDQWAPWQEVDPNAKMVHSGPEAGVGAKTSWDSTGDLGTGSATIAESVENQKVVVALEYTKPFQMNQEAAYLAESLPDGKTKVTWKVGGKNTFIGRVMCFFMNMDKHVGGMFEKGLNKLKSVVEAA